MTIIGIAYKKRKLESIYYLISYSLFLVFISLGLIDSHFTLLPGDPFSYFKIGTVLEFIGFTYFITVLIKKKLQKTSDLEVELLENKQKLHIASEELEEKSKQLNNKQGINKTDLVGISNILQNSFSTEAEWQDYLQKFKELNPTFLEQLLNPNRRRLSRYCRWALKHAPLELAQHWHGGCVNYPESQCQLLHYRSLVQTS